MERQIDIVIVGAGLTAIYSAYKMRAMGLSMKVLEAGKGVGGTWYWNRYPGARCDVESIDYSFSFSDELQQEWNWTQRYSGWEEILKYLNHVVDRFELRRYFQFNTRVIAAHYDDAKEIWRIQTDSDEVYRARYLMLATGFLSAPVKPDIPGLENFTGQKYFTSRWPEQHVSFTGKRVGLIGNGSSGIQLTPVVAQEAAKFTLFQRTGAYTIPAWNRPLGAQELAAVKAHYSEFRDEARKADHAAVTLRMVPGPLSALEVSPEERARAYEEAWLKGGPTFVTVFRDILTDIDANRTCADFVRRKIREIVKDPAKARKLLPPVTLPIGCRRLVIDSGYYNTFNRTNTDVVDLREDPIQNIEAHGIRTRSGLIELDSLILATGFEGMLGALHRIDIRGRDGVPLREAWKNGPRNNMGLVASGFPNLFMPHGPLSVGGNVVTIAEMLVDWIIDLIAHAEANSFGAIDATLEAENKWIACMRRSSDPVVAVHKCSNAWWTHKRAPGQILIYFGTTSDYFEKCAEIARSGYEGFTFKTRARTGTGTGSQTELVG